MDPPSNIKNVFSQPTLLVKVGPEKREYYVHKSLATQHSRYFRDVTQSRSGVESKTADIVLPEVDPIIFEAYVHWLYRQQLLVDQEQSICWSMVTLYEFANQFLIPALKNAIVHELTRLANSQPIMLRYSTVIFAFEKLPKESPILLLLSDIHCKHWTGDSFDEDEEDLSTKLPHDFLLQVMRKYARLKKSKRYDMKLNPADYVERRNRSSTLSEKGKQILNHSDRREG